MFFLLDVLLNCGKKKFVLVLWSCVPSFQETTPRPYFAVIVLSRVTRVDCVLAPKPKQVTRV